MGIVRFYIKFILSFFQLQAMLEQSKAKHDALVSQAQTQQMAASPATSPLYAPPSDLGLDLANGESEPMSSGRMLMPKPPMQPSYKRPTNNPRLNRFVDIRE